MLVRRSLSTRRDDRRRSGASPGSPVICGGSGTHDGGTMHALSLEYHDVVDGNDFDVSGFAGAGPASYKLTRSDFERHLDAIASSVKGSPSRVIDWLNQTFPARPLFLTFDDGGLGASMCIAEALERRGWRGHFLVTAQKIGSP